MSLNRRSGCARRASRSGPGRRRSRARRPPSPGSSRGRWRRRSPGGRRPRRACSSGRLVPRDVVVAAVLVERQHEPLARRVELARRAVQRRQGDALHRPRRGRRPGTGRAPPVHGSSATNSPTDARAAGDLDAEQADGADRRGRRRRSPTRRRRRAGHARRPCGERPTTSSGGMRGEGGEQRRRSPNAGRNERVTASVTVSISCRGPGPCALSPSAPRSSNTRGQVGHLAAWRLLDGGAQRPTSPAACRDRSRSVVSIVRVAPSVARSMPASRLDDSTGAIRASPSTSPAWRAPIDTALAWIAGPSAGTAAPSRTSWRRSNPAPHAANATAAMQRLRRPGSIASPTSPRASSSGRRRAATSTGGAAWKRRPTSIPSGSGADEQGALDRAVAPHLDGQQHAEEQRGDERGEHEREADVGDDRRRAAWCPARRGRGPRGAAPGPPARRRRRARRRRSAPARRRSPASRRAG